MHKDLAAAFATLPVAFKTVTLRGFDVDFHPITVETFAGLVFRDQQLAIAAFGVHLEGGRKATTEEIQAAKSDMSPALTAALIAESTREPAWADLVPNFTPREKSKSVNAALMVTTGGDFTGFFADVRDHLELMVALFTAQQSGQTEKSKPAKRSTKATRS